MSDQAPRKKRVTSQQKAMALRKKVHESRVAYVADLMRDLKFRSGDTTRTLAREWNQPLSYVQRLVVEASRRVRSEINDPDIIVSKITTALNWVIEDATATGDRMAIIRAAQVWAEVAGVQAPTKVDVVTADLTAMTPEQIQARKAELAAKLGLLPKKAEGVEITVVPEKDSDG